MKNSSIHHLINIRANHGADIFINPSEPLTSNIKWLHENVTDNTIWGIEFDEGYFFNQLGINTNRDLTKSEYKRRSHHFRQQEWEYQQHLEEQGFEMDMSGDCREEPLLNPGGGPYNPWDNI